MRSGSAWPASAGSVVGITLLLLVGCVGGEPADLGRLPPLDVVVLAGDGQFAPPHSTLSRPFEVLVRDPETMEPEDGVRVEWEVREGRGGSLSRTTGFTDGAGRARSTLTLGPEPAGFRVRASFPDHRTEPVEFRARAVLRPELHGISVERVAPGSEVVLEGENFVPEHDQIDVLFSGIRARVLSGDETSLEVRVPDCLNESRVSVAVGLGPVRSDPLQVEVEGEGTPVGLVPGDVHRMEDPEALSCLLLEGGDGREYLTVVHSTSAVGAALHRYGLVLRVPGASGTVAGADGRDRAPRSGGGRAPWDAHLRRLEADAVSGAAREGDEGRTEAPAAEPRVPERGDRRTFDVLNRDGSLEEVRAEVRYVSEKAVVYVDLEEVPGGGFRDEDVESLAREFDDPIHPTVTGAYGRESDLDGNDRVVILFTPVVNRLSDSGSDGFVGGFFYGVDLLPGREGSNEAEIFYAIVPDPEGTFGDPRTRADVLTTVPAILAHEFQHMVHFNQRILIRKAERTDALWLSEALATTAESLVAEAFAERGNEARADLYRSGNRLRARRFLGRTARTSLVVNDGSGTLEERGAGWLFLEYLRGRADDGVLADLTRTTRTGTRNVTAVMGEEWAGLVGPWTAALYVDGLDRGVPERYLFGGMDLRETLSSSGEAYPLRPAARGSEDVTLVSEVRSSSAAFSIVKPESEGGVAVNLSGPEGGALPAVSELALTVVRLR